MALNLEAVLRHVKAYVAVADRRHEIVYRNRRGPEEVVETDPAVVRSIEEGIAAGAGFGPLTVSAPAGAAPASYRVEGEYLPEGLMVVTAMEAGTVASGADNLPYIANMSHEIRTPVNAIAGFSRLLAETGDEEKKRRYVAQIETNTRLLMQLVDDVLDMAKMTEGELKFRDRETDLNELLLSVDSTVRFRVQPRTMLNAVMGAAECRISTDPERLSQVLINLLTNAIKFTSRGSITFGYELWPDSIYFFVKDTGMGIAPEKQPLLFKRFSKQNDREEGTGLGLSICKEIVERFGGEIGVESAGIGKGSLFWFTIPATPLEGGDTDTDGAVAPPAPAPMHRERKTLLVAEDNESNYFLISSMLEDDYNLLHAWNGREAVEIYEEKRPDLILMDINMPLMDGYEATRRIRQVSETVPVIAVTAYAFASDRTRIMENGFNSYVSKPVNAERLESEIKRLLK